MREQRLGVLQRLIFWLDERTSLLEKIEVSRANWFEQAFRIKNWIPADVSVLDIGCGVGDVTSRMSKYSNNRVIGIDTYDYRRVGTKLNKSFEFVLASGAAIPFRDSQFERVTMFWTLHHVDEPMSVLREAFRVLKTGGELVILEDTIPTKGVFKRWFTHVYDRIINLDFQEHPHSNKPLGEWDEMISSGFTLNRLEMYSIPWLTPLHLLEFGVLRYMKLE